MKTLKTFTVCLLFLVTSLHAAPLQEQNKAIAKRAFEEILSKAH
jgi:hypothetical protein